VCSFQFNYVTKLCLIVPKVDIHYISFDEYIVYLDLYWISIVFYAKHRYIESFELNLIYIVFCYMDRFIESFNMNNRTCIRFNCLLDV
jgi:hypothetical protein